MSAKSGPPVRHVFHITTSDAWNEARTRGAYLGDTFESEGFIHCSTRDQVIRVADQRFAGRSGLVLLAVDLSRVDARVVFENTEGGSEPFPHLYGPIPIDAIIAVAAFEPDDTGRFRLPAGLAG